MKIAKVAAVFILQTYKACLTLSHDKNQDIIGYSSMCLLHFTFFQVSGKGEHGQCKDADTNSDTDT